MITGWLGENVRALSKWLVEIRNKIYVPNLNGKLKGSG